MTDQTESIRVATNRSAGRLMVLAFITGLSGAMMPGPFLVAVIEQTSIPGMGMRAVFWLVTGHLILELVIVFLLILGLQSIVARPRVRASIGIIGGAALLYMGGDMVYNAWGVSLNLKSSAVTGYSWIKLMVLGAAVCAANPYFTGWWATVGAGQLAHMKPKTKTEYLSFFVGHEAADYAWYTVVGIIIITGRRWLTDNVYHGLILTCGIILLLLGLWFIAKGLQLIFFPSVEPEDA